MAESYFELLTEQSGMPAKPFDPVGELKRLRQRLAVRMQTSETSTATESKGTENNTKIINAKISIVSPPLSAEIAEPVALETVVKTVNGMRKTLEVRQRTRFRRRLPRTTVFLEKRPREDSGRKIQIPAVVVQYLTEPQEGKLEIINAGLTALGIIVIVFSALSFCQGWESDLSLGMLVSISGFAVIGIGLGGRLLASRTPLS